MEDFIKNCEEGIRACKDIIIKEKIERVIISGVGMDIIPGYFIKSYLHQKNIIVTEDYANPDVMNYKTLVILISQNGEAEQVLSHYRIAMRNDCKIIAFNDRGKLLSMFKKNREVISFSFNQDISKENFMGFSLFGTLTILRNSEIYSDAKNELVNTLDRLRRGKVQDLSMHLAKRLGHKIPLLFTTKDLLSISKSWKMIFNVVLKRRLFFSVLPNAMQSDLYTYENRDDAFYSIIIREQEISRELKSDIEILKEKIKKNGQDVIEIALSQDSNLQRLLSSYLICINCATLLKVDAQLKLEEYNI